MMSKAKRQLILTAGAILSSSLLSGQGKWGADSVQCYENYQIYYQMYKSKQYASAYEGWNYVYTNCPEATKNTFIFGPKIIKGRIKATTDPVAQAELVEQLIAMYQKRLDVFPGKEGYVYGQQGMDLMKYKKNEPKEAYDAFMKAYAADPTNLPAAVLNGVFVSAARLYNKKVFSVEEVFTTYNFVSEAIQNTTDNIYRKQASYDKMLADSVKLDAKQQKDTAALSRELVRFDQVNGNVEKILAPIATCEKLQLLYNETTFAENQGDADWLRRASKMLSKERKNADGEMEDCTDLPIFFKIAEENYKLEPSAISARAVGKLAWSRKDYAKAVEYFKEASDKEVDPNKKADDNLKVAISYQKLGQYASCKSHAIKAAGLKKRWGDPYLLLAQIYGAAEGVWGSNAVEKKATYWAAIDKANYAASIDPEAKAMAAKLIASYKKRIPDKAIAFQLGSKEGDRINIGSWINESVIVEFF